MYHNIQNNIHDYQKLKNFKYIFWFEKVFYKCMCGKFFHVTTHVIKTKNYFEKYVCWLCVYTEYTPPYI